MTAKTFKVKGQGDFMM